MIDVSKTYPSSIHAPPPFPLLVLVPLNPPAVDARSYQCLPSFPRGQSQGKLTYALVGREARWPGQLLISIARSNPAPLCPRRPVKPLPAPSPPSPLPAVRTFSVGPKPGRFKHTAMAVGQAIFALVSPDETLIGCDYYLGWAWPDA